MALVAVFGASGRQGLAQVRQLIKAGHDVRALSRAKDPFYGETFEGEGTVDVMPADVADDQSLKTAVSGVDAVFYTHPVREAENRVEWVEKVGQACADAGVGRMVWNTSMWIPDRPGDPGRYGDNTVAINRLWRTGCPATVFGSVLFMDNLLTGWAFESIVRDGIYTYPHNPFLEANWISLDDVAKFMIAAIDRPDLEGAWVNIGGPDRLRGEDVAQILSETLGRPITFKPRTPAEFGKALADAFGDTITDEEHAVIADRIEKFYVYNNFSETKPFCVDMDPVMSRFPGLELESMRDWAARQDWTLTNKARPPGG
ncbi:MAG: NmrA family NAD(P)-binding protein [Alphaproteobacteria bacterium]|nr:NmrA family NAD(P)-binding protein [Alphaproteobacteria bacterium]